MANPLSLLSRSKDFSFRANTSSWSFKASLQRTIMSPCCGVRVSYCTREVDGFYFLLLSLMTFYFRKVGQQFQYSNSNGGGRNSLKLGNPLIIRNTFAIFYIKRLIALVTIVILWTFTMKESIIHQLYLQIVFRQAISICYRTL